MIKVYSPTITVDLFAEWFGFTNPDYERCDNIDEVLAQPLKIACLPVYFDHKFNVNIDYQKFDLLLLSDVEFSHIRPVTEWIGERKIKNYLVALGGVEGYELQGDFIYRPWWCFNLVSKNTYMDVTADNKPFEFEVLLGAKKPHRDLVMAKLQKSNLLKSSIVNYRTEFQCYQQFVIPDKVIERHIKTILGDEPLLFPYISENLNPEWEVSDKLHNGISEIVPWQIYKHTKYSTILETIYQRAFFFTEKAAKVLFAKRVFVAFSSAGYLKNMHKMGFKTFANVIDESYDDINDDVKRIELAYEQMERLAKMDYAEVMAKTKDITEHNYNRLFSYRQEINKRMLDMVYNKVKEIVC